jgi:signal transduction histidine kinase
MKLKFGITSKLFILYLVFFLIFCGTTIVIYLNVKQIMTASETIVLKNNKITLCAKKMIEQVLNMEENIEKYRLLKKKEYWDYYLSAQKEFEKTLNEIMMLNISGLTAAERWETLYTSYSNFQHGQKDALHDDSQKIWIPVTFLNQWIQIISEALAENEHDIEMSLLEINRQGQMTARNNLIGLGLSIIVGLFGSIFLANSMIRPIRRLRRGIRAIAKDEFSDTIQIKTKDEFGELAVTFNEMTKRLKEEERMRSDFISMLSHEIRTPLTSIRESVNLIIEEIMGPVNQRQRKFLEIASLEIGRISDLLNHLMQVSRMESGALETNPCSMAPNDLVMKSINHLKPLAQTKNIKFNVQIPDDIPNVIGTPDHLHQVMLNIVGNAIKFSNPGETVGVYIASDKNGDELTFSVSDSGPGISKEEISFIFNKYFRAKDVREHLDGVGLGLSISKQIIIAHGGKIWVQSVKGRGSIFRFTIPAVKPIRRIIPLKTEKKS